MSNDNQFESAVDLDSLEQISKEDGLIDRGVDDLLDEGYVAPDNWSPAQGFGNTPEEMRRGETIEQRISQEQPEESPRIKGRWNPSGEEREVGAIRAGRLIHDPNETLGNSGRHSTGHDVGIAGGAASAEEAAIYIIDESKLPDALDEEYARLEEDSDSDGAQ